MIHDTQNNGFELAIRTRSYSIVLDIQNRSVSLARAGFEPKWSLCLRCDEEAWSAC